MKRLFFPLFAVLFLAACQNNTTEESNEEEMGGAAQETTEPAQEKEEMANEEPQEVSLELKTIGETMNTMEYEPNRLEVPAGAKVNLTLVNEASAEAMIHNAVFIERGKQMEVIEAGMEAGKDGGYLDESHPAIIAATELAYPGETKTLTFTAPDEPGTYQYICTYPGHTSMKGILIVK